ncbi:hypothetical protein CFIMG_003182RA [Ceratocystis fimbriata CBS 114723]|uniref:Protein Asterix n=1 Tax=Ceratocystis fimbriata CBS 114723 TaxID=1035309 RepID=A0A2C5X8Z3_9PEZI|nr:hypothetical protein CFIMG_003182RA [Ceratocystis fimbriata CBS 114723]
MSARKDQRRIDLIVPYQEPAPKDNESVDLSSSLSSTMPMAAMMTRNRYFGWGSFFFSMQSWLGESESTRKSNSTPGYFSVIMSFMALVVTYLPMFMPPPIARGTNTEAPAPVAPVL